MRSPWLTAMFAVWLIFLLISPSESVLCYECNVWKAGYGHLCDNPRIRDDCLFCMKIHSTVRMGYFKNTPRYSEITSRVCAKSPYPHFSHECWYYKSVSGETTRCFCDTDLCNSAPKRAIGLPTALLAAVLALIGRWQLS